MSRIPLLLAVFAPLAVTGSASAASPTLQSIGTSGTFSAALVYVLAIVVSLGTALGIKLIGTALRNFNESETE